MAPLRGERVIRVVDVLRESEVEERTRRHLPGGVGLPLLLQHRFELRAGERGGPEVVEERQHEVCLGVGDDSIPFTNRRRGVEKIGTHSTRVDEADFGATELGCFEGTHQRIGDEVAERGLRCTVVSRPTREGTGDVSSDGADRLVANDGSLGECGVDNCLHLGDPWVGGDECGVGIERARHVFGGRAHHFLGDNVVAQNNLADVLTVVSGLQNGASFARLSGNRCLPRVLLVGVAGEDRVDLGSGVLHDVGESTRGRKFLLEGGTVGCARARTLVVLGDDDVSLIGGGDFRCHTVNCFHRIAVIEGADPAGGHEGRGLLGDRSDDRNAHAVHNKHFVLVQRGSGCALEVDVRAEVGPVGGIGNAAGQVAVALVELVVSDCGSGELECVEDGNCRLVAL